MTPKACPVRPQSFPRPTLSRNISWLPLNYDVELGQAAGAIQLFTTKAGTNQWPWQCS